MRVPLFDLAAQEAPHVGEALTAIERVAHRAAFVLGDSVDSFERWLADRCGAAHAVGVASGTDAIELTLRALGVGPGDAVITPALSFVAAAEAVVLAGAIPRFCDVDASTMNVSIETVADAIGRARGEGLRVRAILPVDLFGLRAPLAPLCALAEDEGVSVVEDAAQAIGAFDALGARERALCDAACFSFFPTKNLGAWGDGGAITTHDGELASRLRRLRAHGCVSPYVHAEIGRNSRLDALQAAVLLTKAPRLAGWQRARVRLAARYTGELGPLPIILPAAPDGIAAHGWHLYVVRCERREELAGWLSDHGIETRAYYPLPLHRQACFAPFGVTPPLPATDEICRTALALPLYPTLSFAQQSHVIEHVRAFFRKGA